MANNSIVNNIFFGTLILFLFVGAYKNNPTDFSLEHFLNSKGIKNEKSFKIINRKAPTGVGNFKNMQSERIRQKIDYSTALEFVNQRGLSGTEILELQKRPSTAKYFERNSDKKLIFYPTTGANADMQRFMRDFTKFRTSKKKVETLVFLPVETALPISEKQIKTSLDRVFYNLKKECGKFCIINVPARSITSLKSPEIGSKTIEVVEAVINSL